MKYRFFLIIMAVITGICACSGEKKGTSGKDEAVERCIAALSAKAPADRALTEKGVRQTAALWHEQDGSWAEFEQFCLENFFATAEEKRNNFLKISDYMEAILGSFNEMTLGLTRHVNEATGALLPIDEQFAAFSPDAHFSDDMYASKLAFIITLNFPHLSLEEKEALGNDRLKWAYARLGDLFTARVPSDVKQAAAKTSAEADVYVSNYNIYAGCLLDRQGVKPFPEDMVLLSHWNLRDEIKANYNKGDAGLNKQQTVYAVMKRIISQDIPVQVINSGEYDWNPYDNSLFRNGKEEQALPENGKRYETLLSVFQAQRAIDRYTGNTFIERNFSEGMEVSADEAESMLRSYLGAAELRSLAKIIEQRLGRPLQAFDIWYDGFKPRSAIDEERLSALTRSRYSDAATLKKELPQILVKLGFAPVRAAEIADKIDVDAARGSGHAWGAVRKGQHARLRTRIGDKGMDYKGFNIAVHEFGHNVEQTISLYNIDYYMLNGVPNTAFTEALAFVFQKRDLEILGLTKPAAESAPEDVYDKAWSLYEIGGVSLLDILVWKWLYANPEATAPQLQETVIRLATEIWNEYYAPVLGVRDEPVLAIYSHTLSYPLYLTAYSYGQIIHFQIENFLRGKDFAAEVERMYRLGRLTPNQWMIQATGSPLTVEPLLEALKRALCSTHID